MTNTFGSYKHVLLVGIDGMGTFNQQADTPNMDKLFAGGAVTNSMLAAKPTVSAEGWSSILIGTAPETLKSANVFMRKPTVYPTIFARLREVRPEAETAAFVGWTPILHDILSPDIGLSAGDAGPDGSHDAADDAVCDKVLAYLEDHDPELMFIQFDNVDHAGHSGGYGAQMHLDCISHADLLLGKILDKYKEKGLSGDTLFLVTADHGGTIYCGHGDWSDAERFVFFGAAGKNVLKGDIGASCLRDIPAIVLHALGVPTPAFDPNGYAAQLPVGIFPDAGCTERQPVYPMFHAMEARRREQPQEGDPAYIGNFIDADRIRFWQTFEENIEDVTGRCRVTTESGIIKRYHNGFVGNCGEYGAGVLKVEGVEHSDVFSIAFWFRTTQDARWMDLFSNADGIHDSFSIAPYGECVGIYIKEPDGNQTDKTRVAAKCYEASAIDVWTHFLFEVDLAANEIRCYVDFELVDTLKAGRPLAPHFDLRTMRFASAQHGGEQFYKVVDDVMIIDGPADPIALKKYYQA